MKKFIILLILLVPINVFAKEKVELFKCVDGDTARFILNKKEIKVRFIGIDAPELDKNEDYAVNASNYTCNKLKKAKKIEIEYDKASDKKDKYDRVVAYVFIDGNLLEELIVKNGYAKVKYIDKDYKYYDTLMQANDYAISKKKGIYSDNTKSSSNDSKEEYIKKITNYITKNFKKFFGNILREIFD